MCGTTECAADTAAANAAAVAACAARAILPVVSPRNISASSLPASNNSIIAQNVDVTGSANQMINVKYALVGRGIKHSPLLEALEGMKLDAPDDS